MSHTGHYMEARDEMIVVVQLCLSIIEVSPNGLRD